MKEKIIERLEKHAMETAEKDILSPEELNFLIFWLNRIEMKENAEESKRKSEESNERWKGQMLNMIETLSDRGN